MPLTLYASDFLSPVVYRKTVLLSLLFVSIPLLSMELDQRFKSPSLTDFRKLASLKNRLHLDSANIRTDFKRFEKARSKVLCSIYYAKPATIEDLQEAIAYVDRHSQEQEVRKASTATISMVIPSALREAHFKLLLYQEQQHSKALRWQKIKPLLAFLSTFSIDEQLHNSLELLTNKKNPLYKDWVSIVNPTFALPSTQTPSLDSISTPQKKKKKKKKKKQGDLQKTLVAGKAIDEVVWQAVFNYDTLTLQTCIIEHNNLPIDRLHPELKCTMLHFALAAKNEPIIHALIAGGANPNTYSLVEVGKNNEPLLMPPLVIAILHRNIVLVDLFLTHKNIDINLPSRSLTADVKKSPLSYAAACLKTSKNETEATNSKIIIAHLLKHKAVSYSGAIRLRTIRTDDSINPANDLILNLHDETDQLLLQTLLSDEDTYDYIHLEGADIVLINSLGFNPADMETTLHDSENESYATYNSDSEELA